MKILILTRSINNVLGGLERQINEIASSFGLNGHDVLIVSLDGLSIQSFFETRSGNNINWTGLGIGDPARRATKIEKMKRQFALYLIIKKFQPDISFSFMIGAFIYGRIPLLLARKKLVLCERNSPEIYRLTSARRKRWIYFFIMIFANKITIQFERYKSKYPVFLQKKFVVIPNQIVEHTLLNNKDVNSLNFVFAGRFSFQKQIQKLIIGFSIYKQMGGVGKLILFGDGEQKNDLINLIDKLSMSYNIELRSAVRDMGEVFSITDVNCLFSKWEGFPNIVAEALKLGIPTFGFNECDGLSDLIVNNYNGWLIEDNGDSYAISNKLFEIEKIYDGSFVSIKENCKDSVQKFDNDLISFEWESLIKSI
jgi:glycosyltransferase involved in cell wall biosynthesis